MDHLSNADGLVLGLVAGVCYHKYGIYGLFGALAGIAFADFVIAQKE